MADYILGIDIGGTSIKSALYAYDNGVLEAEAIWKPEEENPFIPMLDVHKKQIADLIDEAYTMAYMNDGKLLAVGAGSPGFFDKDGKISVTHNPEFLGADLAEEYRSCLYIGLDNIPILVQGDAEMMLSGIYYNITKEQTNLLDQNNIAFTADDLKNSTIALLGIGTGVGHCLANVSDDNVLSFPAQCHASELLIDVDDADWHIIDKLSSYKDETGEALRIFIKGKQVRAEDLFRGPILHAIAQILYGQKLNQTHDDILSFAGKYLARLIKVIASGEHNATAPNTEWSDADKKLATKTKTYFIAGGLGSSPLGKKIVEVASKELENLDVKLIHFTKANVAEYAAALSVVHKIK